MRIRLAHVISPRQVQHLEYNNQEKSNPFLLQHAWPYIRICSTRKISRCHNLNRPEMEHPHSTNCRQSKQIVMFYQKKSKSTITNNKRTSISNLNKTQIRIRLHCLGSSHKRKHKLARKGTATGSQIYMQQTS